MGCGSSPFLFLCCDACSATMMSKMQATPAPLASCSGGTSFSCRVRRTHVVGLPVAADGVPKLVSSVGSRPSTSRAASSSLSTIASRGARPFSSLAGLVGPLAALGSAVTLRALSECRVGGSHKRKSRPRALHTQRRFFGNIEDLNPFKEKPDEKARKEFQPQVDAVNALEDTFKTKSDDDLREVTAELKEQVAAGASLDSLLPQAFALVREASYRVLGLRPFDVQLMGGIALHNGTIAEMGTGEGKTLVAILPAFLNALSGKGVHVVTVNDYLARRDAEWVGQPLRFLGLTVGVVQAGMVPEQRRRAYRCDVTYVTNSELGFDYLRDQMAPAPSDLGLREKDPFNFAIVDEVDSILIDEARTPLIISGIASNPSQKYTIAKEVAQTLRKEVHYTVDEKQRQCVLIEDGVDAAEKLLGKNDLFDPQDPWFPFLVNALNAKEVNIKDKQYIVKKGEVMIVDEFTGRVMEGRRWSNGLHQAVEAKEGCKIQPESVTLASISYQSLFRLFGKLGGMTGTAFTEAKEFEETYKLKTVVIPSNRNRIRADMDDQVFAEDIGKWKAVARDVENAHRIGRPVLIGTTNVENSEIVAELLDALGVPYQLLNAKPENVARETEIIASSGRKFAVTIATNMAGRGTDILLGGNSAMMGRLKLRELLYRELFPDRAKFWAMPEEFYPIDLSKNIQKQLDDAVRVAVQSWTSADEEAARPNTTAGAERLLAGELTLLEAEERLALACEKAPTEDTVLLNLREAYQRLCAEYKQVTDIEKQEAVSLGGLYVIGTERHESRRIDNQLRGRCARQGDPGATRFYLSLNDTIFRIFGGEQIKRMMSMMSFSQSDDVPLESGLLSNSLEEAQKKVENYYYSVRKNVFEYDDVMDTQRQIVYSLRRRALLDKDDNIVATLKEFSERNMEDFVKGHIDAGKPVSDWFLDKLAENVGIYADLLKETVTEERLSEAAKPGGVDGERAVTQLLIEEALGAFDRKNQQIEDTSKGLTGVISRQILLMQLDNFWQQHLKNMEFLKTAVTLRSYGQKQPLTEYKLEGYQVFLKMMSRIRRNAIYNIFLFTPRKLAPMQSERIQSLIPPRTVRRQQMKDAMNSEAWVNRQSSTVQDNVLMSGKTSTTINLARLALNVRALLDARGDLKELALASFGELKESFGRAGLLTVGDQLRWASACSEFELLEDDVAGEIYIGLKAGTAEFVAGADQRRDEDEKAREVFSSALQDPEFLQTIDKFADSPDQFLALMKQSVEDSGFDAEQAASMRKVYNAAGMDLDETLRQMEASLDELPPQQRAVVEYMSKLLKQPPSGDIVDADKQEASEVKV
mmetsp:Transcript_75652/g.245039  ORF Transcript_75652/g.245039 Transcript_75652/m.245039 type:complete len:1322 (+) Transcript_75652:3-3968(+)